MIHKLIWAVSALAILALAGLYLPLDFLRPRVERALERNLGRKVEVGQVHLNLFGVPGLTFEDVVIHEDPRAGIEPFAYVPALNAGVRALSLLRHRLDFSSLNLGDATVNLVKSSSGTWNFQFLFEQASKGRSGLPGIKMRGGRVNFKFGDTKSVFYFDDADLDVSPYGQGSAEVRFWGAPRRTDRPAREFGHLFVRGNWAAPTVKDGEPRLDLRVELERSALDEVSRLADPRGFGLHGVVSFQAQLGGPPSALKIAGGLQIEDVHRWDLLPQHGGWTAPFEGVLDLIAQKLELASATESASSPVTLRFGASKFLSSPQWEASAQLNRVPLSALLEIARHMGAAVPAKAAAEGGVSGQVSYTGAGGLTGRIELQDASLNLPDVEPLRSKLTAVSIGDGMIHFDSHVEIGPRESAEIEGSYSLSAPRDWNAPRNLDIRIATRGISVADMRSFGLAGIPVLEQTAQGSWRGWARFRAGEWSGEYDLQNARIAVEGLAEPLRIQSASVRLDGKRVLVGRLRAREGATAFTGDYQWDPDAPRPHRFNIVIPEADAAEVARALAPTLVRSQGFLARTFGLPPAPAPDWLKKRRVDGVISIAALTVGSAAARIDRARLLWDASVARLVGVDAHTLVDDSDEAAIAGDFEIGLRGRVPHFKFDGKISGLRYKGGEIDLEGSIEADGLDGEILESAHALGRLRGRSVSFAPDAEFRTVTACFEMTGSAGGPQWKLGSMEAVQGGDTYTGFGLSQPDGKLVLDLNHAGHPARFVAGLAGAP
ncbi:MAG TPA: hypothetical protein VKV74_06795 [Bryobacteraceae bacterium]|nr:hypothetical protein [Bryobacteraceae bacterium]